jgi:hypothetical protein
MISFFFVVSWTTIFLTQVALWLRRLGIAGLQEVETVSHQDEQLRIIVPLVFVTVSSCKGLQKG